LQEAYQQKLSYENLKVFAGLNQVSAGLNRFKPHVWQKQVFAGRNPTLSTEALDRPFRRRLQSRPKRQQ